jgi:hypothetical protein
MNRLCHSETRLHDITSPYTTFNIQRHSVKRVFFSISQEISD